MRAVLPCMRMILPCMHIHLLCVYVVIFVLVFTLNRSFYPTSAVPPVTVLILHPKEIQIMWSQTVRQRKTKRR